MKKKDKKKYKAICHTVREDGAYVEAGENDNLIVQKLEANPNAFGVFGFSFLDQNADKIQGSLVDGVEPTFENIADGNYPVSRSSLLLRQEGACEQNSGHAEFIAEFTSENAFGRRRLSDGQGADPDARSGAQAVPRRRCRAKEHVHVRPKIRLGRGTYLGTS